MNSTRYILRDGVVLEYGTPTPDIIREVSKVSPHAIRPCDMDELMDTLMDANHSLQAIRDNFGLHLTTALGMYRDTCRYYMIRFNETPLFVATLTQVGGTGGTCLMCGFGVQRGYVLLTKRDLHESVIQLFIQVIRDMKSTFNVKHAVCHVKATNSATLLMWRWVGRRCRNVAVSIMDDPFMRRPYKLVTVSLDGGDS